MFSLSSGCEHVFVLLPAPPVDPGTVEWPSKAVIPLVHDNDARVGPGVRIGDVHKLEG